MYGNNQWTHLGCFNILAIVNNAAMNMGAQITLQDSIYNNFEYITRSGIAVPYSNSIFNYFRSHHDVCQSGSIISHSHQQCTFSKTLIISAL